MNEDTKILTVEDVISTGRNNLPNDEQRNAELVDQHVRLDIRPRGCVLDFNVRRRPSEAVWKAVCYIGGAQRVIARGTLYQCARAYDVALLRWAKLRTRHTVDLNKPETFNFNKEQARRDILDVEFVMHFGNLEDCWKRDGIVLQKESTETESRIRSTGRQAVDRIESRLDLHTEQLEKFRTVIDELAKIKAELSETKAMLHKVSETLHRWYSAPPTVPPKETPAAPTETPTIFFAP